MSMDEQALSARAEVTRIFTDAGWTAGTKDGWDGEFVWRDSVIVGGIDPYDTPRATGMATNSTEWPGDIIGAAHWLVDHAKQFAPSLTTDATLETPVAPPPEAVETAPHESDSETGEEAVLETAGAEPAQEPLLASEPLDAEYFELPDDPPAEVEELGSELLGEGFDLPVLEEPEPDPEPEPEHPSGAFIFGDNLAHDRIVRIGQLAEYANGLIDAAKANYNENEYNAARAHVVTNMNQAGAYVGGDQVTFDRFIVLDAIISRVNQIETYRDTQQDYIRSADRESVASFDPEAGWPT